MKFSTLIAIVVLWCVSGCSMTSASSVADPVDASWPKILADAIVLRAKLEMGDDVHVTIDSSPRQVGSLAVSFAQAEGEFPVAQFVLVPWQTMTAAPGTPVTVTPDVIVLQRDLRGSDVDKSLAARARQVVEAAVDAPTWERENSQAVPSAADWPGAVQVYEATGKHNYVRATVLDLRDVEPSELARVAPGRMLHLVDSVKFPTEFWVAPAPYEPKRPEKDEQQIAREVDLKAAAMQMETSKRGIFAAALARANSSSQSDAAEREALVEELLPELRKVILAYPGHNGPARSFGESVVHEEQRELRRLLALPMTRQGSGQWGEPVESETE